MKQIKIAMAAASDTPVRSDPLVLGSEDGDSPPLVSGSEDGDTPVPSPPLFAHEPYPRRRRRRSLSPVVSFSLSLVVGRYKRRW